MSEFPMPYLGAEDDLRIVLDEMDGMSSDLCSQFCVGRCNHDDEPWALAAARLRMVLEARAMERPA